MNKRNWTYRALQQSAISMMGGVVVFAAGCVDPPGGTSDVPCVTVSEWNGRMVFRGDGDGVLVTVMTFEDDVADAADGHLDYIPHSTVYRLDAATEEFGPVPDERWDDSQEPVTFCCNLVLGEGGFAADEEVLRFNGNPVEVGGGVYVTMTPSSTRRFVAVLSTNGRVLQHNVTTGQHFHQIFSVETGEGIGPVLRVGVVGGDGMDWTEDERFVVYEAALDQSTNSGKRVCIVDRQRHGG